MTRMGCSTSSDESPAVTSAIISRANVPTTSTAMRPSLVVMAVPNARITAQIPAAMLGALTEPNRSRETAKSAMTTQATHTPKLIPRLALKRMAVPSVARAMAKPHTARVEASEWDLSGATASSHTGSGKITSTLYRKVLFRKPMFVAGAARDARLVDWGVPAQLPLHSHLPIVAR